MKKIVYKIFKYIIRWMINCHLHWPLVVFYSKMIKQVLPKEGKTDPSKPRILAINEHYFIRDLEILAETREFNVLKIPIKWQSMLLRLYWADDIWGWGSDHRKFNKAYYQPEDPAMQELQRKLHKTMAIFLKSLFRMMNIKCVISANFTYKVDYDWSLVTHSIGTPLLVFHKENLTLSPQFDQYWLDSLHDLGKFKGTLIILHNNKMKEIVLKSGFATEEQIKVLGCLRMDGFIRRIRDTDWTKREKKKRVLLFSFQKNACLEMIVDEYFGDRGFVKFFEHVHVSFAEVAKKYPDYEFIIKPKYGREWFEAIEKVLNKNNLYSKDIPNLKMIVDRPAQDLIFESDLVCGFASTTVLESAVAHRKVIIPHFDEPAEEKYKDYIVLLDHYDAFEIARSPEQFKEMIEAGMKNPEVSAEYVEKVDGIFDRYVSSFNANSTEKYVSCVKEYTVAKG